MRRIDVYSGFSLIELLIVIVIMSVVVGAIGASLSGGGRVWDAALNLNASEREIAAGLEMMHTDLMNTFVLSDLSFVGRADGITVPGVVKGVDGKERTLGSITYTAEGETRSLVRRVKRYVDGVENEETLVRDLEKVELEYFTLSQDQSGAAVWQDAGVQTTVLPARVDIRLTVASPSESAGFFRVVLLPGGRRP